MRKIFLSFYVLVMLAAFSACKKSNPAPSNNALVMFVDGCAGASTVDVKLGTTSVPGATGIALLNNSGYQNVVAGTSQNLSFFFTNAGAQTLLTSGTTSLTANTHYSVFAGGGLATPIYVSAMDDLTAPASTNSKIRFVNLSPDNLSENCYVGTQKLDSNVKYSSITPFFDIPAVSGVTILLQDPADPTKIAQLINQNLVGGKIYTVMVTGAYVNTGPSALKLTVINNN